MFPGVILLFAVGWVLYVAGKKYEKPPSPALVRTDLNTGPLGLKPKVWWNLTIGESWKVNLRKKLSAFSVSS
jgi:hypothetical protein